MKIKLTPKRVYGRIVYYPSCYVSKGLASLKGRKDVKTHVFQKHQMQMLSSIGFEIELVQEVLE